MDNIKDISIENIPKDYYLWRVDWFGRLRSNRNQPSNHILEVVISKVGIHPFSQKPSYISEKLLNIINYGSRERKIITIAIGELAAVTIGSLWWNGKYIDSTYPEIYEPDLPELTMQNMKAIHSGWKDKITNDYYIPFQEYPIGKNGMTSSALGIHHEGQNHKIIISAYELLRFYYGQSSSMLVKMFKEPFSDLLPTLYDNELTRINFDTNTLEIKLKRNMSYVDARCISGFLDENCKPDTKTEHFKRANKVLSSVQEARFKSNPIYPIVYPPINEKPEYKLAGKWVISGGERRFIVFKILSGKGVTNGLDIGVLNHVGVRDDYNERNNTYDKKVRSASFNSSYDEAEITPNIEPNRYIKPAQYIIREQKYSNPVAVRRVTRNVESEDGVVLVTNQEADHFKFSTGEGKYADTGARGVVIKGGQEVDEDESGEVKHNDITPADFNGFKEILSSINDLEDASGIELLNINSPKNDGENIFPDTKWSRKGKNYSIQRRYMLAELMYPRGSFYLMDIERRLKGEKFALYLVYEAMYREVDNNEIEDMADELAKGEMHMKDISQAAGYEFCRFVRNKGPKDKAFKINAFILDKISPKENASSADSKD